MSETFEPSLIKEFFQRQLDNWPQAADNYRKLSQNVRKPFQTGSLEGFVQFNPGRLVSNQAKVDSESIKNRKCFLCSENRPQCQLSLNIAEGWELLVNPFPILNFHLTVASLAHIPQELALAEALTLSRKLPGMILFYNDPGAGASAPDHRHFQAVEFGSLPLVTLIEQNMPSSSVFHGEEISERLGLPFKIILFDFSPGQDISEVHIEEFNKENHPVNAFFWNRDDGFLRMLIVPRKAHRPACYFKNPPHRRAVSPGAIDMGGIIVVPHSDDFLQISSEDIAEIYSEVGY